METVADIAMFSHEPTDSPGQRWDSWVRGFDNYIVAKNIQNDKIIKSMLLHYVGEAVFELSDVVGVIENDNFAETKRKLTEYFRPQCNEEYEIFKFSRAEQMAAETLDQYNTRLQQLAKHCNFHEKDREVKPQIIQRYAMSNVRDKGLSEPTITLQRLFTFGRTLEATIHKSKGMVNLSSSVPTPVHAVSKDGGDPTLHVEVSALHNRWRHTHIEIHQENISRLTVSGRHVKTIVQS